MRISVNDVNNSHFTQDYHVLTDELIKTKIASTAGEKIMNKIPFLFIGGFVVAALSMMIGMEWIFTLVFPCLFLGIPGTIVYSIVTSNKAKNNMTRDDMANTQLYLSEFVGTRRHHKSKGGTSYYIKYLDETGCQREQRVNSVVYREFKDNLINGDVVVLLKYPKYRSDGFGYHIFDAADFINESSFPNPPELDDFCRRRDTGNYNGYNNQYHEPRKEWNSQDNNEDW